MAGIYADRLDYARGQLLPGSQGATREFIAGREQTIRNCPNASPNGMIQLTKEHTPPSGALPLYPSPFHPSCFVSRRLVPG